MDLDEMTVTYHQQAVDDQRDEYYHAQGISRKVFDAHQLGWIVDPVKPEHERFKGMAVIPYMTAGDLTVAMRAGVFEGESAGRFDLGYVEHRFPLTAPKLRVYNVGNSLPGLRTSTVHLVERVLDVLRLRSEGERAVAIPGYQNFHEWWAELFQHSEVVLHDDGTKPEAINEISELLRKRRITFVVQTKHEPTVVEAG